MYSCFLFPLDIPRNGELLIWMTLLRWLKNTLKNSSNLNPSQGWRRIIPFTDPATTSQPVPDLSSIQVCSVISSQSRSLCTVFFWLIYWDQPTPKGRGTFTLNHHTNYWWKILIWCELVWYIMLWIEGYEFQLYLCVLKCK